MGEGAEKEAEQALPTVPAELEPPLTPRSDDVHNFGETKGDVKSMSVLQAEKIRAALAKDGAMDSASEEEVDEDEEDFFVDPTRVTWEPEETKRWWLIVGIGLAGWVLWLAFYIVFMIYLAKPTGLSSDSWSYNGYNTNPDLWPNISSKTSRIIHRASYPNRPIFAYETKVLLQQWVFDLK